MHSTLCQSCTLVGSLELKAQRRILPSESSKSNSANFSRTSSGNLERSTLKSAIVKQHLHTTQLNKSAFHSESTHTLAILELTTLPAFCLLIEQERDRIAGAFLE